jgi:catechol 2,3-dioxygenase-like lactoylglutathione lyase family enzyme
MVCGLHVNDIDASLAFWREMLGFAIAYHRPDERLVYREFFRRAGVRSFAARAHPVLEPLHTESRRDRCCAELDSLGRVEDGRGSSGFRNRFM